MTKAPQTLYKQHELTLCALSSNSITDAESLLVAACKSDLGKPTFETYISEIDWVKNDIVFVCQNLAKWARDESAPDIPLTNKLISPTIRKDPLGCVLIIGFVLSPPLCFRPYSTAALKCCLGELFGHD